MKNIYVSINISSIVLFKIVLLVFLFELMSCNQNNCSEVNVLDVLKNADKVDLKLLNNVSIDTRIGRNEDCIYKAHHYTVKYKEQRYKLPNFSYYNNEDSFKHFHVKKYLNARKISLDSLKKETNKIFEVYEKLNVIKIWNVDNAVILFIDKDKYLLHSDNIYLIENEHWRKFISKAKSKDNWYWIENH